MTSPYVAEIRPFACNFAPRGWAMCNGQILAIAQNTALFSLLGTTYGGNGQTTFALPDLRGRTPIHTGQGPSLSQRDLGEQGGEEIVTLLATEMPAHTHTTNTRNVPNNAANYTNVPTTGFFVSRFLYHATSSATAWRTTLAPGGTALHPQSVSTAGGSQPHGNQQPYLAINYCIALQGVFPARN